MRVRLLALSIPIAILPACDRPPAPPPAAGEADAKPAVAAAPAAERVASRPASVPARPLAGVHAHDPGEGGEHVHLAPHNGMLVVLADHQAHLELVLDDQSGRLTVYLLDGECEKAIRIKQPALELKVSVVYSAQQATPREFTLSLLARENPLTGETVGDSSEFVVESPLLVGLKRFTARVARLSALGVEHEDLLIEFPQGGE